MGHAQVTTPQIYTAGADPKLAAAYQTAMAQLSQPASAPTPEPPAASAPQLAVLPLPLPPLPDLASRLTEAPTEIREHCLAYYEHCLPTWNPRRRRHSADSLLYSLEGFWRWQSAQRPITRLSELTLADLRTYQQTELAAAWPTPRSIAAWMTCWRSCALPLTATTRSTSASSAIGPCPGLTACPGTSLTASIVAWNSIC